jgi:hypothetical protein
MRSTSRKKFKSNIRKKLAGEPVSFTELVEGAGGITGLNGHSQSKRVGAWPPTNPPIEYIGSVINSTYTNTVSLTGLSLQGGDTLLVCCGYDSGATFSLSSATSLVNTTAGGMNIAIFALTISEIPPSTVNVGGSANTIIAAAFRNVNSVGIATGVEATSNVATITPSSVTFSNGGVAVIFAAQDDSVTATATAPTGYTIAQQGGVANGTQRATGALMYKTDVPIGIESPSAVTWSETDTLAAYTIKLEQN